MNIYKIKWLQIIIVLLFPIMIFAILLFQFNDNKSFWVLIVVLLIFCGLWKDIVSLLISNLLTWVITIPIWWILVARHKSWGQEMLAWSPVTFVYYLILILTPIILVVLIRNVIIGFLVNKKIKA
jgi:hypothetical protein